MGTCEKKVIAKEPKGPWRKAQQNDGPELY